MAQPCVVSVMMPALLLAAAGGAQAPSLAAASTASVAAASGGSPVAEAWTEVDGGRPFGAVAMVKYSQLIILDEDPRNDLSMRYMARGNYALGPMRAGLQLDLTQKFWTEAGDSAFRLQDVRLAVRYDHSLPELLLGRPVSMWHEAAVYVPTSRVSRLRDQVLAASWVSEGVVEPVAGFGVGLTVNLKWLIPKYAEQAGQYGGMNERFIGDLRPYAEYTVLESERFGTLLLGLDFWGNWSVSYPSRDDFESPLSDRTYWRPSVGWDGYLTYAPIPKLMVTAAVEHGGPVRDDGVINVYVAKREDTTLTLSLLAVY